MQTDSQWQFDTELAKTAAEATATPNAGGVVSDVFMHNLDKVSKKLQIPELLSGALAVPEPVSAEGREPVANRLVKDRKTERIELALKKYRQKVLNTYSIAMQTQRDSVEKGADVNVVGQNITKLSIDAAAFEDCFEQFSKQLRLWASSSPRLPSWAIGYGEDNTARWLGNKVFSLLLSHIAASRILIVPEAEEMSRNPGYGTSNVYLHPKTLAEAKQNLDNLVESPEFEALPEVMKDLRISRANLDYSLAKMRKSLSVTSSQISLVSLIARLANPSVSKTGGSSDISTEESKKQLFKETTEVNAEVQQAILDLQAEANQTPRYMAAFNKAIAGLSLATPEEVNALAQDPSGKNNKAARILSAQQIITDALAAFSAKLTDFVSANFRFAEAIDNLANDAVFENIEEEANKAKELAEANISHEEEAPDALIPKPTDPAAYEVKDTVLPPKPQEDTSIPKAKRVQKSSVADISKTEEPVIMSDKMPFRVGSPVRVSEDNENYIVIDSSEADPNIRLVIPLSSVNTHQFVSPIAISVDKLYPLRRLAASAGDVITSPEGELLCITGSVNIEMGTGSIRHEDGRTEQDCDLERYGFKMEDLQPIDLFVCPFEGSVITAGEEHNCPNRPMSHFASAGDEALTATLQAKLAEEEKAKELKKSAAASAAASPEMFKSAISAVLDSPASDEFISRAEEPELLNDIESAIHIGASVKKLELNRLGTVVGKSKRCVYVHWADGVEEQCWPQELSVAKIEGV